MPRGAEKCPFPFGEREITMERILLKDLSAHIAEYDGKTVTVAGWARTIRDSKAFGFIELNDGSMFKNTQIVFERASLENYDEIAHENVGAALIVTGKAVATPENKQPYEIKAEKILVEGEPAPDYPLQRSGIRWSSCAASPICAPAPISFPRCSACAARRRSPSTNFSTAADLYTCTPPSSRAATAKARAGCFR